MALKILRPGLDAREVIAHFEAERQVLALMDHPNTAPVFAMTVSEAGRVEQAIAADQRVK